jgi:hypothetical protein
MGTVAECFDNVAIEVLSARMRVELLSRRRRHTRLELATAMFFDYLWVFLQPSATPLRGGPAWCLCRCHGPVYYPAVGSTCQRTVHGS